MAEGQITEEEENKQNKNTLSKFLFMNGKLTLLYLQNTIMV